MIHIKNLNNQTLFNEAQLHAPLNLVRVLTPTAIWSIIISDTSAVLLGSIAVRQIQLAANVFDR